jgi:hypothetical protein
MPDPLTGKRRAVADAMEREIGPDPSRERDIAGLSETLLDELLAYYSEARPPRCAW